MANFSKNITNSVRVFGGPPSTKWGQAIGTPYTMVWGTSKWGETDSLPFKFVKLIQNTQGTTFDYYQGRVSKAIDLGSMVASGDLAIERLSSGNWDVVFTSDTSNAENRSYASWNEVANPDATFTCQAAGNTSWSEA